MPRRDPLASALFSVGCAMVIGAPLIALAVSCSASGSQGSVSPSRGSAATPAPGTSTASPQRDAQEADPPSPARFIT